MKPANPRNTGSHQEKDPKVSSAEALKGIRVVEFAVYAAGPLVGKHLGEHGAEVIRVESVTRPDGFRVHYPPFKDNRPGLDRSGTFALFNDEVLSVTLNLKDRRGIDLAKHLVARADIVIENFALGVMKRLGLDYQALRKVNEKIIMLSSCNQGQTGPRASQRGFGSQLTSLSGFTDLTGYTPAEPPMLLYGPYIDFIAVGFGLIAVLSALDFRRRTGKGQHIDLSQYEAGLQFLTPALLDYQVNGRLMRPQGNRDLRAAPHGAYPCKGDDAWCVIAVFSDQEWRALCETAGHSEWASDPRFESLDARKENEDQLDQAVAEWSSQFTSFEVMGKLQDGGVPSGVVQSIGDLFSCSQLNHRGQWKVLKHRELKQYPYQAPPFVLSETPARLRRPSPCLGEHNDDVLSEILGIPEDELRRLQAEGVLT
ncbi:MAG: CoA transferase [Acidobacteria bacterium]|nr:CoA transferase [Acidobacteriota bacterium]